MESKVEEWTIEDLLQKIENKEINLRPSYQRNDIWTKKDQRELIDTIKKGFPLPNFFIRDLENGKYEMVDGQQRALTIKKYVSKEFVDSEKKLFDLLDRSFMDYKLSVTIITEPEDSKIKEFFYLVNKKGVSLNSAEINNAYFHDTDFKTIIDKIAENQMLVNLELFSTKTSARMNDISLIEELLAYLFSGISEKRIEVDKLYCTLIDNAKKEEKYNRFCTILKTMNKLNDIKPLKETRYRQRNDFYTLFNFVDRHENEGIDLLLEQYSILVFISDNALISPSKDQCTPFYEYAINCVSQSNSKKARESRLNFFESLLCNTDEKNETISQIRNYFLEEFNIELPLKNIGNYLLIDFSGIRCQ